ncbi:amidohydrolase family protein [Tuwongella immobilis]|uniref:Amidohydrolase-related domain-containing protein n=1 Tax=Tuwongella immobilis TaxID=692036 RepID=A0A6C2YMG9_9BACT|nr:amidohydrolase family protein [Tuwongella immobilis]VIP02636.1 amidohydrolase 2 : Amidohydrolase 2 OS=Rhodopirellula maiorica SM1 GN=RMSM_01151 PE=4 SV=1: Amidohydro_2 [Tuwongella immobilis]VTS01996.1 amidohydrolase 2 : Amidohydrolase 2 OS=Rhodopirellula maiorica SM1 GN=RMSM_01151 PE=4 SV=1: Amidohydro_2 [Tuwongella immobilis]
MHPSRRQFLAVSAAAALSVPAWANESDSILDCHTHFYDPTRPVGVPWPGKADKLLYRRVLPADYHAVAKPLGITGTVIVEASSWVEDNQWLLDLKGGPLSIPGIVGRLAAGTPEFAGQLERFRKSNRWLGMRLNADQLDKLDRASPVLRDLKQLSEANRELDINGGPGMLPLVNQLAKALPDLRILINHCANLPIDGKAPPAEWIQGMTMAAKHSNVFCKVSSLVGGAAQRRPANAPVPADPAFYRPVLHVLWDTFGPDRLIFGSDWPVSERFAPLATVFGIVDAFFRDQGQEAYRKFFAGNAARAYRWPGA